MTISIDALSPFELSLYLEKQIQSAPDAPILNAGRGNPNWTAPVPREAFFLLGQFAVQETRKSSSALVGKQIKAAPERMGRLQTFLTTHPGPGADFLNWLCQADQQLLGMMPAAWVSAACDAVIGDNYPAPVRCLSVCEQPLKAYMIRELFDDRQVPLDVFPVEGGTAGICYLFDTLMHTGLLAAGDRIALLLPTFAPYLEIPKLPHYAFDVVRIKAQRVTTGDRASYVYPQAEIEKLRDPKVKAAFVVNPSNPTANAMGLENISQIEAIVNTDRPDLMILTDDVYGTFVPHFLSLFAALPHNTACLYSFSKYFGATGWRVGAIALAKDNVFDELIDQLPKAVKAKVSARYQSIASESTTVSFIDRIVADSRDIALNHAAGLSTVQQVMIALFSLYGLMDEGQAYKDEVVATCRAREQQLFSTLGLTRPATARDTAYYCDIDLLAWGTQRYGAVFARYLKQHWTTTRLLVALAQQQHLMLLKTSPFGSDTWSVRVSLANLPTHDYAEVGKRIIALFDHLQMACETEAK
ncbi:aspartate 4-decarboxylase [Lactobacillus paracasei]|uniref:aspartate 4-decarboxylase n=1 Tax=Lacticaseibacillus paracasei TaxID=1597 RepID=UPI0014369B22|nr:aspartate 4-decarboxylase [Lacticaseibacillus paracasei]NKF02671.1 aspartate 4-decarboxylase [Lacticaseibacillus paracasei]